MNPSYLLQHPLGPITRNDIIQRIEAIDYILRFLDIELQMSEPIRGGYPIPDHQMQSFLRRRRGEYVSMIPAVTRLPPEIWKRVFSFASSTNDVLACASVSRTWRHAVLTMPKDLLKDVTVFVRPQISSGISCPPFAARLIKGTAQNQLAACLLDASFSRSGHPPKSKAMADIRLALYRKSLKRLYISPQSVPPFFGGNQLNVKYFWEGLTELVIDASDFGPPPNPNHLAEAVSLEHLRSLRRLTINVQGYLTISRLTFPRELEYLHVDDVFAHSSDLIRVLSTCTSLNTLILACHWQHPKCPQKCPHHRSTEDERILFPRLRHLVLIGGDRVTALLSHFKLPSLVVFRLANYAPKMKIKHRYLTTGDDIVRLVNASGCSIQKLELHSVCISDYESGLCFNALRSLTYLKVYDNGGLSALLDYFITPFRFHDRDREPKPLVPNLVTLLVQTTSPSDWPRDTFNGFANARKNHYTRCLVRAELSYAETLTPFVITPDKISNFVSSLKRIFGIAVRAPYLPA